MDFSIERTIELLQRTPGVLRSLLHGLSDEWTTVNEGPDTWSAFDVLGHLAYAERGAWIGRAEVILSNKANKTFPPVDRFAQFRESVGKNLPQLLDEFALLRSENLQRLRALDLQEEQLQRSAVHPQLGPVTLAQLLATWATHDLDHISQVVRVLAKQYGDAVGPWKANLKILRS
ncbi:MAG: DinB family protein [Chitinophagaceae bacterium]|nr:MAG: DinB family protein [Chitinophagaceae bacterium]